MDLEILGKTKDIRTNTDIIYGQMSVSNYLELIGTNYDQYGIQRRKEKHRAYSRMKEDIKAGALLPAITLAVNQNSVYDIKGLIEKDDLKSLKEKLQTPGIFSILDGLQRTYILTELSEEKFSFKVGQKLLLEFWVEPEPKHLIYRLIILNAGQKPMSLRHQIELLFMSLSDKLKQNIDKLDIFKETEERRRSKPGQFPFERLVTSYQSFLWKTPELNKNNIVAQNMMEESVWDSSEEKINETFQQFNNYLKDYVDIDFLTFKKYISDANKYNWLASENVMNSFFAAISDFGTSSGRMIRINESIKKLKHSLSTDDGDPLGLEVYFSIVQGFPIRKINVGVATRRLLLTAFKEYFREEGEKPLDDCWLSETT